MNSAIWSVFVFIIIANAPESTNAIGAWSHHGTQGPRNWAKLPGGEKCIGLKQSPIDIQPAKTVHKSFEPFQMTGYDVANLTSHPLTIVNNGHTVQVNLNGDYIISGGGLPSAYKALQFHLHWGSSMGRGSEHTKDGKHYAAEMHIVHYDHVNYPFPPSAIEAKDGLAVLGFWIKQGRHNVAWEPIDRQIISAGIRYTHESHIFNKPFTLSSLLPHDLTRFYRYSGSLTTPGCYESVVWTVFNKPIELSRRQIGHLRRVSDLSTLDSHDSDDHGHHHTDISPLSFKSIKRLVNNYRPTQPLWFRRVYQSFNTTDLESPSPVTSRHHNSPKRPHNNSPQAYSHVENSTHAADQVPSEETHTQEYQEKQVSFFKKITRKLITIKEEIDEFVGL